MLITTRTFCLALCAASGLTLTTPSFAQAPYPDHPVKVIVALPAGGSVDMIARQISQQLTTDLGQPFVVDNRAGGGEGCINVLLLMSMEFGGLPCQPEFRQSALRQRAAWLF